MSTDNNSNTPNFLYVLFAIGFSTVVSFLFAGALLKDLGFSWGEGYYFEFTYCGIWLLHFFALKKLVGFKLGKW